MSWLPKTFVNFSMWIIFRKEKPIPKYFAWFDSSFVASLSLWLVSFCASWKHQKTRTFLKTNSTNGVSRKFFSNFGINWEVLVSINPSRPDPGIEKTKLNFYIHASLWCLIRFHEGFKGLHKTFWGITTKCENKKINFYFNTTFWHVRARKG